ncbi:GDP-L-fucose synthase [Hymenobacter busanensis]|uniref:GDP-L-fucose synthase n=1 Tax=Hymenobacter busanensis TaxID=2607656 RepID=A0A7L5A102_9BACT|nr:GDP-L-fucose synthase [Hymenobacter busanensis]KAA9332263.1 GDP-L-fucose synthase [Hymenobacter busanensis]QHJ07400.1 NAD-dependent epimerase/dehydratase family protein [Hymenobacter busanensis]
MDLNAKIYVAGHRGMVGSALVRRLRRAGYQNLVTRTTQELDLRNQAAVAEFFATEKPEYVLLAAAKVGGIHANNTYPADFLLDNLQIQNNVIQQSYLNGVTKLLFLGSSCIYPKMAPQPIKEEYLLTGALEPTNEAYALAKIAGLKLCEAYRRQHGANFISAMPTNLYGPGDNYNLQNSHVLPALLRKFHEAKLANAPSVEVWGSGTPRREFLHVDDLADACFHLLLAYNGAEPVNVGTGKDITIRELAELVKDVVGYTGDIQFNTSQPDGTPRKLLDVSKLAEAGWQYSIELRDGVEAVYKEAFSETPQSA